MCSSVAVQPSDGLNLVLVYAVQNCAVLGECFKQFVVLFDAV